jgi:hypothetical protein
MPVPHTGELTSPGQAGDAFAGMRQMRGELLQPVRPPQTLAEAAARQRAGTGTLAHRLAPERPGPVLPTPGVMPRRPVDMGPVRTFVGTEQSALNRYLSQAERSMREGQYYRAADEYEIALAIAPDNPLPSLGRSLALLAAGEYMSSASSLFRAISSYEGLAEFPVDLPAFIPDVRMLDRRRADLERRLEGKDDFRLRFLLGYAEYCSGLQKLGFENMQRAAAAAPVELEALRRFVASLALRPMGTTQPGR